MSYLTAVLADSPVHYWRMADPLGQIAYDIGSAPFPLMSGRNNVSPFGYSGVASDGGSAEFDTASNPLRSWDAIPFSLPVTWEGWIWMQSAIQGQQMLMSNNGGGSETRMGFVNNTTASFVTQGANFTAPVASVLQHWHHVALTVTGGNLRGYVDGTLLGTQAGATAMGNGEFSIGRRIGSQDMIVEGFVAEVALYNAALSAGQLAAHIAAADTRALQPIYKQTGSFDVTIGAGTPLSDLELEILNSVRRSF